MSFQKITESESQYRHLEKMTVAEVLLNMNREDAGIASKISIVIPAVTVMAEAILDKMLAGGRLFYIGAGTSGRLGVVDASECPPSFGVPPGLVVGIIAGGPKAMFEAVENAEDDIDSGWKDLTEKGVGAKDFVLGITASGSTPYVSGALKACRENGISTGCLSCNPGAPASDQADFPVEMPMGPEFVTGSTRLKAGSAQKMVLNMISTAVMIGLGRVEDNKMVHMQLTNEKLRERAVGMVMAKTGIIDRSLAMNLLNDCGSVKKAISAYFSQNF
jgi:N-acetylmuramic acid 6-phosphate etherase